MRLALEGLLDLIAPGRCPGCEEVHSLRSGALCVVCEASIERYRGPGGVFEYGGAVAEAIQRFKYEGRSEIGRAFGPCLAEEARASVGPVDAVVPVPLHWRRRRARGYDQAALLAQPVARLLEVPVLFGRLRRTRHTPKQADLSRASRFRNVRGAFHSKPVGTFRRLLLVDDVKTTGATLNAATSALLAAGAEEVHTLVLAVRVLGDAP